jgi:hypothetical protein
MGFLTNTWRVTADAMRVRINDNFQTLQNPGVQGRSVYSLMAAISSMDSLVQ